jgi:hypothetical protein
MKYLCLLLLCLPLTAQQSSRLPLPQLKEYLQLTTGQIFQIVANNDDYNRQSAERQSRIRQVLQEIADETAKPDIDSRALALRYSEIEWICRELKSAALDIRQKNLALLDDKQKTKLTALQEAIKLLPVIADAHSGNIAGNWMSPPTGFSNYSSVTNLQLQTVGGQGPVMGCLGTGSLVMIPTL